MPKNKNKGSILTKLLLLILLVGILYITAVWFFPVSDLTGGKIDRLLNKASILLGVRRYTIISSPEREYEDLIRIIGNESRGGEPSSYYATYFSSTFNGDVDRAKSYEYSIDRILSKYIKKAKKEIKMAMYDLEVKTVESALMFAYNNGVSVKIVTDTDNRYNQAIINLVNAGIPVRFDNKSAIMHNKFVVIDDEYLWTGSYNATNRGSYFNNNNAVMIYSEELARQYNAEFNEMFYDNKFGAGSPDDLKPLPKVSIKLKDNTDGNGDTDMETNKIDIQAHFAPDIRITKYLIEEIHKSKKNIYFMTFSFTKDEISYAVIDAYKDGIVVEGIFEQWQMRDYSEYTRLHNEGISVSPDGNRYNVHHKVMIIDEETVITGSANFSNSAERKNDENILIIKNKAIAKQFLKEYKRVKQQSTNNQ